MEPGPTQYPIGPLESDPLRCPLCSLLCKYLIKNVTTVDIEFSHSNSKLTNFNLKIRTKANSVLFATRRLNSVGRSCAYGLISAILSRMCWVPGKTILNNNFLQKTFLRLITNIKIAKLINNLLLLIKTQNIICSNIFATLNLNSPSVPLHFVSSWVCISQSKFKPKLSWQ